jgi:hypothetical protein
MAKRPPIPIDLHRLVLIEAGHRCAIHTCQQVPVEIAHIDPWARCRDHRFENLIALCPTCHTRFDQGEIDRKSMLIYKQRLGISTGRYGDFERRVLSLFAREPDRRAIRMLTDLELLFANLLADGFWWRGGTRTWNPLGSLFTNRTS